jgi:hypothetical protein
LKYIEVTAGDNNTNGAKTILNVDSIISISEYGGKKALICAERKNGDRILLKCRESYKTVKKRLLDATREE